MESNEKKKTNPVVAVVVIVVVIVLALALADFLGSFIVQ